MRFIVMSSALVLNLLLPVTGGLSMPMLSIGSAC